MKKLYGLMLAIIMTGAVNATNYFVDTTKGASGAGDSWETAFKTLLEAENAANANAGIDNIYIKGGVTISTAGGWTLKAENYYFSCDPANTGTSIVRTMNDNDANGSTEPWEFKYPTIFSSTYATVTGTAISLVSSATLDGLTITHSTSRTNGSGATCINPIGGVIQNCVFTGSNLSYPGMTTSNPGGCLIRTVGTLMNSLIDKNTVSITNTSTTDLKAYPILDVNLPATSTTVTISGCVFRNNKATIDYSSATATTFNNLRGMVLNISDAGTSNTAGTKSTVTVSDCVVYNNEITFTGNATITTTPNACIATHIVYSGSNTTNNWINNTFANNKSTNLKGACMALYVGGVTPDFVIHNVYNNVFWNNQNTISATSVTSNVSVASGSAQNLGSVFANNVMDIGTSGNLGTNLTNTNNLTNLSKTNNTSSTGPQFKRPSSAVGYLTDGSVELADWRLDLGSYLAGRGTVPVSPLDVLTIDKAGNTFGNPRASGAYDFVKITPVITWNQTLTGLNNNLTLTGTSTSDVTYGAPIVYTSNNPGVVSISGSTLTVVATGSTTVTASQAANNFYNAALPVTLDVEVTNVPTALKEATTSQRILTPAINGIISEVTSAIEIYSVSGKLIKSINAIAGEKIYLQSGIYVVKANTEKGAFVHKVVL